MISTALSPAPPRRPRRSGPIPAAARALCLAALACLAAAPGGADPHWPIIEAYAADAAAGESPDIAVAVAAARAIVAEPGRPRAAAAAMFLMDAEGSATEADDALLGAAALAGIVGSDWSAVRAYLRERRILQARVEDIRASDAPRGERDARIAALARPAPQRAVAAALASLDAGDAARAGEAVRFLLWEHSLRSAHHILPEALRRYAQRFPGDAELPVLLWRAYAPPAGRRAPAGDLLEQFAQPGAAPAVRATARYLLASRVAEDAGRAADAQQRRRLHARSLRLAQGLSAGVEEQEYAGPLLIGADPSPRIATFAQAEAELLYAIRHTLAGGTPPATQGRRLDGTAQALSAFAGKVVLVDFWATWCPPCVAALPKLRDLVARHSGGDFALLSISVDDSVDEVADFQYDQPMPWPNWHAGLDSDLLEAWRVRDFPTYLLLDRSGAIIARTNVFGDELLAALDQALAAAEG